MKQTENLAQVVTENVRAALFEDLNDQEDVSAQLIPGGIVTARVITREQGIFCGTPWITETIKQVDEAIDVEFAAKDGERIEPNQLLFSLTGSAQSLLTAERTILNFVQLLSGTATKTAHYVSLVNDTGVQLLDTRKTLPGWRELQKYAVWAGGGTNHRQHLAEFPMVKDNHRQLLRDLQPMEGREQVRWIVERLREAQAPEPIEL